VPVSPVYITPQYDLSQFKCNNPKLTEWLKRYALQSNSGGQTKTLVVTDGTARVIAYYAYAVISVGHESTTPERIKKGLAKFDIPVFLIARLAVDTNWQGKGLGRQLLRHALERAAIAAQQHVPIRAVVVDAINDEAKTFYEKFNFEVWPIDGLRMWLMMKDIVSTLRATG
jgi:predicted N-acetyltransferase YhbS